MKRNFVILSTDLLNKNTEEAVVRRRLINIFKQSFMLEGKTKILNVSEDMENDELVNKVQKILKVTDDIAPAIEVVTTLKDTGEEKDIIISFSAIHSSEADSLDQCNKYLDQYNGITDELLLYNKRNYFQEFTYNKIVKMFNNNKYKDMVNMISQSNTNLVYQMDTLFLMLVVTHKMLNKPFTISVDKREKDYVILFATDENKYYYSSDNIYNILDKVIASGKDVSDIKEEYLGYAIDNPEINAHRLYLIVSDLLKDDMINREE